MKFILFLLLLFIFMGFLFINTTNKYKVDYCGTKDLYQNAKDYYKAGKKVRLYFPYIATDTDYSFYLDNEPIRYTYDNKKGFIIEFIMPPHNVKLNCNNHNSMEYIPE